MKNVKANQVISYNEAIQHCNQNIGYVDGVLKSQLQLHAGHDVLALKSVDARHAAWVSGILIRPRVYNHGGVDVEGWEVAIIIDHGKGPYLVNAWFKPNQIILA